MSIIDKLAIFLITWTINDTQKFCYVRRADRMQIHILHICNVPTLHLMCIFISYVNVSNI